MAPLSSNSIMLAAVIASAHAHSTALVVIAAVLVVSTSTTISTVVLFSTIGTSFSAALVVQ